MNWQRAVVLKKEELEERRRSRSLSELRSRIQELPPRPPISWSRLRPVEDRPAEAPSPSGSSDGSSSGSTQEARAGSGNRTPSGTSAAGPASSSLLILPPSSGFEFDSSSPFSLEALIAGPACPQKPSQLTAPTKAAVTGSEDCLFLNIWSPPNAVDLPVMFWIHGGGNTIGHGGSYSGAKLATAQNVVLVTINYRLGLFGWFSHPALQRGDPLDDSGNYGTLDMVEALKWVQANIATFGGNPANVTVFGESAGAVDTLSMMASPLAKGLFHRSIVQSGGYQPATVATVQNYIEDGGHENSGKEIVNQLLCLLYTSDAADE